MGPLNTVRAVLVAGAALAAIVLAVDGQWVPFAILTTGIAAHGALWLWLWRQRPPRRPAADTTDVPPGTAS